MVQGKEAKVAALCEKFWQWRLKDSPDLAVFCGYHDYDDRLDDLSAEAYKKKTLIMKEFLQEAEAIDMTHLEQQSKFNLQLLIQDLKNTIEGMSYCGYYFPINFMENPYLSMILRVDWIRCNNETDYRKYISSMKNFVKQLNDMEPLLREGIEKNLVNPIESVREIPQQIDNMIGKLTKDSCVFYKPFEKTSTCIQQSVLTELKGQLKEILLDQVKPAMQRLKDFFDNVYLKHARQQPGVCHMSNGREFYKACIRFHTSCDMSPEEIHEVGLREVARIKDRMMKIYKEESLPLDIEEAAKVLSKKRETYCHTEEELLEYVKDVCYNKIRPQLPKYFKDLPNLKMEIKPAPAIMANSPAAFYLAGTQDGLRSGSYMVNLTKLDACPKHELLALSLHEGEPGHHTQAVCAMSAKNIPRFRCYTEDLKYYLAPSRFALHTAYMEGWGLYAEALGEEMGLYTNNLLLLGRYNCEIHRACRLVVDTGIHAFGWSTQKALDYMKKNCPLDSWFVENEINRYITWPGQALGYKIGEMKIWEFRKKAEKELGDKFDVRDFHDVVLKAGGTPLSLLEELVNEYIKETKQ